MLIPKIYRMKGMLKLKKGLLILIAAALSLSMAACGKDKENADPGNSGNDAAVTGTADATETPTLAVEGAAEQVDMGKVDGTELKDTEPEDTALSAKGEIGNFEVAIKDAKVIDYEGQKVIVISYDFTSHNATPTSFTSIMQTEVTQAGNDLRPAVVLGVEGVNTNSSLEQVETDGTVTVQETFILNDETTDVNVTVHKYGETSGTSVSKAFALQ